MAAAFNPNFNPAQVMMRNPDAGTFGGGKPGPYLGGGGLDGGQGKPTSDPRQKPSLKPADTAPDAHFAGEGGQGWARTTSPVAAPQDPNLAAQTVRATGSGPFDQAYRQNLATYSGGQFMRPGGNLSFNPTGGSFPGGNPLGGGTDPLSGGPTSLLAGALGGQGFNYTAPVAPAPKRKAQTGMRTDGWQDFVGGRSRYGRGM